MATVDCRRFDEVQGDINDDRKRIFAERNAGEARLPRIASEIKDITREIARLTSNLTFLDRMRPRGRRRLSDELGDAHRLLNFEDARRKIGELEERQRKLESEAAKIRSNLTRVDRRLTELRNEELTNRRLAEAAGCWR